MPSSPLNNFIDKFKSSTKQAAESMKLAGRIAGLKVERSTQKAEKERLIKEIGNKTYSIYNKTKTIDSGRLLEEILSEVNHVERIENRLEELEGEIRVLQEELLKQEGKGVIDATVINDTDDTKQG